jgi:hypothetical protein
MSEVIAHNKQLLDSGDTSGLIKLVIDAHSQSLDTQQMRHVLNRHNILQKAINSMLDAAIRHNKNHSGLSKPRMGSVHKFFRGIDGTTIASNSNKKKIKEFIDSLTFIYMMIQTESSPLETMDMIVSLKNQYEKVMREL